MEQDSVHGPHAGVARAQGDMLWGRARRWPRHACSGEEPGEGPGRHAWSNKGQARAQGDMLWRRVRRGPRETCSGATSASRGPRRQGERGWCSPRVRAALCTATAILAFATRRRAQGSAPNTHATRASSIIQLRCIQLRCIVIGIARRANTPRLDPRAGRDCELYRTPVLCHSCRQAMCPQRPCRVSLVKEK